MAICIKCSLFETLENEELCIKCKEPVKSNHKPNWLDDTDKNKNDNLKIKNKKVKVKNKSNFDIKKIVKPLFFGFILLFFIIGGVLLFTNLNKQKPLTEGIIIDVTKKNVNSFGFGAKLERDEFGIKYNSTPLMLIYKVGCENDLNKMSGDAFTISIATVDPAESSLLTSSLSINDCISSKKAYLSDGISVLPVDIIGNDADLGVALIKASVTLPSLANNIASDPTTKKYIIIENKLSLYSSELNSTLENGSVIINQNGESVGLISNNKEITIRSLCNGLLIC
jgi:hypothetical protein